MKAAGGILYRRKWHRLLKLQAENERQHQWERVEQEHINALAGYIGWQSYVIRTSWRRLVLL